jgi:hypothetical protein
LEDGTGKLAFAEALGLVDAETKGFIEKLGQIRNAFVHNVKNVGMTLDRYFATLNPDHLKSLHASLNLFFRNEDDVEVHGKRVPTIDPFVANGKLLISASLGAVLLRVHELTQTSRSAVRLRASADRLVQDVLIEELEKRST